MKLQFLGTAAAEGIPAPFCECKSCRLAREKKGKYVRRRSSLLINDDLLIDCGPDFAVACSNYGLNMNKLKYLLITHAHFDHWYPENIEIRSGRYLREKTKQKLNILGNSSVFYKLQQLGYRDEELNINRIEAIAYEKYNLNPYLIIPIYANHAHEYGYALNYIIICNDKKILYATDTGLYSSSNYSFLQKYYFDIIIIDSTNFIGKTSNNHLNVDGILHMKTKFNEIKAADDHTIYICTHFSHNGITDINKLEQLAKKNKLLIAYDGMEVQL
ncbi:MAG: MBL fold metallo-hydrolase [Clostridium saudiense]|nr:MBL fold metallo-hydrolase [Clostridium saudiense]